MSLLRILEYDCVQRVSLEGTTLDVGGGSRSDYNPLLSVRGKLQTVNLDPSMEPAFVADLNRGLPVATSSYNSIVSLNTLEHIQQDTLLLEEMFRVLKPGGSLCVLVPFLYRVHASPSDYHRHTACFWAEALRHIGFPPSGMTIEPLTFGPLTAPLSLVEFSFPAGMRSLLRVGALLVPLLRGKLRRRGLLDDGRDTPLDYWIVARKQKGSSR
jgi:SAM-dependent methyltransferase